MPANEENAVTEDQRAAARQRALAVEAAGLEGQEGEAKARRLAEVNAELGNTPKGRQTAALPPPPETADAS